MDLSMKKRNDRRMNHGINSGSTDHWLETAAGDNHKIEDKKIMSRASGTVFLFLIRLGIGKDINP